MPECGNCGTKYSALDDHCPWCQFRREELLERLELDTEAVSLAVVSGWAVNGPVETPERRWRVG